VRWWRWVRTTVPSRDCATATLSTEESFLRLCIYSSPLISAEKCKGGQEIGNQRNTCRRSQLGSQLPARPPYCQTGYTKSIQLFYDWGRRIKPIL
jgi:hypothetical protein